MTDFSTMDPQDLCGWIAQRIDDNWYDNVDLYDPDIGRFHLWACAGAARDWCMKDREMGCRFIHKLVCISTKRKRRIPYVMALCEVVQSTPLDWLVAAAKVIEDTQARSMDAHQQQIH